MAFIIAVDGPAASGKGTVASRLAEFYGYPMLDTGLLYRAVGVRLLGVDPCREDAHRMTMRAYVRLGARAQALRQYNICRLVLAEEFDATPEPATEQLFQLVRTDPGLI